MTDICWNMKSAPIYISREKRRNTYSEYNHGISRTFLSSLNSVKLKRTTECQTNWVEKVSLSKNISEFWEYWIEISFQEDNIRILSMNKFSPSAECTIRKYSNGFKVL
jgi:hypothetical protein